MAMARGVALLLCVLATTGLAKPMFGANGMMRRRFPGAPEMSYSTYQNLHRGSSGVVLPPVSPRTFSFMDREPVMPEHSRWMFEDSSSSSTSQEDIPSTWGQFPHPFPSSFSPRQSFAPLYFPPHKAYHYVF